MHVTEVTYLSVTGVTGLLLELLIYMLQELFIQDYKRGS